MTKNTLCVLKFTMVFLALIIALKPKAQSGCVGINISDQRCATMSNGNSLGTYDLIVELSGGGTGWRMEYLGTTASGSYGSPVTLGPFNISDGPFFLLAYDSVDLHCAGGTMVIPPDCVQCPDPVLLCGGDSVNLEIPAGIFPIGHPYSAYEWYRDGQPIAGSGGNILNVGTSGVYTYRMIDPTSGCSQMGCCSISVVVGTDGSATLDSYTGICPGFEVERNVALNDVNGAAMLYAPLALPMGGQLYMDSSGLFSYAPFGFACGKDSFSYVACSPLGICCDTAKVVLELGDTTAPNLLNVPADITISCDEQLPYDAFVIATDNCNFISMENAEVISPLSDTCSFYDYTIERTWTAADVCGNWVGQSQKITVVDEIGPELFRVYTLANGKKLIAGVSEKTSQFWKYVNFPVYFQQPPLVFVQVSSDNDTAAIMAQVRSVSTTGFEVRLREEEAGDQEHGRESVSWMALEQGALDGGLNIVAGLMDSVDHNFHPVAYPSPFASAPLFLASVMGTGVEDPGSIVVRSSAPNGVDITIMEEQSADMETAHGFEKVAYLALDKGKPILDGDDRFVAESGQVTVGEDWTSVVLENRYNKPVVLFGGLPDGTVPANIRVRAVGGKGFEVRVQTWDYLGPLSGQVGLDYIVVEGGIPFSKGYFCPTGVKGTGSLEMVAVDNCGGHAALLFSTTGGLLDTGLETERLWSAVDACGNAGGASVMDTCEVAALKVKAFLDGALFNVEEPALMRDDLRAKGLLPATEPYSDLARYEHFGDGGGEHIEDGAFADLSDSSIIDWAFVECRDAATGEEVLASKSVLLAKNGEVMSADGKDVLIFSELPEGSYHVSIRHRNHLGLMSNGTELLRSSAPPLVDFTDSAIAVQGGAGPGKTNGGQRSMWAGDFDSNGEVIFQGPRNDIFFLVSKVLGSEGNTDYLANFISEGYHLEDFNLDGESIYQGPGNDRALLLYLTVLSHPSNTGLLANYIVVQSFP